MIYKNLIDREFAEHLISWMGTNGLRHVTTCLHEGIHLAYAEIAGWEPEVYGPSKDARGSIDDLPYAIKMTAGIVVAKFYLAPSFIEEMIFGESNWKEIHNTTRTDFELYRDWKYRIGNPIDEY